MGELLTAAKRSVTFAMETAEAYGEQLAQSKFDGSTRLGKAAQVGTVLTVVTLGITILVGILIFDQVAGSLPLDTTGTDYQNQTELENAGSNASSTFADAMELAPVILIILLAAVVLAVVQRFR